MKIFEILNFHRELLSRLYSCGIKMSDARYIDLYTDYSLMVDDGEKVTYIVEILAEKYAVSVRKVYQLIKLFQSDCVARAVG